MQSDNPRTDGVRPTAPTAKRETPRLVEQAIEAAVDDPEFSDLLYPLVDASTLTHVYEQRAADESETRFVTVTLSNDGRNAPAVCQLAYRAGWRVTDATPSQRRLTFEPQAEIH